MIKDVYLLMWVQATHVMNRKMKNPTWYDMMKVHGNTS